MGPYDSGINVGQLEAFSSDVSADLRRTVLRRFTDGADIGFRGPAGGQVTRNNRSALLRPAGVSAAIAAEVETGTTRGPFATPPVVNMTVNPSSARDKGDGSPRLILDLSKISRPDAASMKA